MKRRIMIAPKVGTVYYVTYDEPERENDGQGAIVGYSSVTERWPTKLAARKRAKLLLKGGISPVVVSKPVEFYRIER